MTERNDVYMAETEYLKIAKEHYRVWCEAELAVAGGQEYEIGSRRLRRADLDMILDQIKYWRGQIDEEEAKSAGGGRGRAYRGLARY